MKKLNKILTGVAILATSQTLSAQEFFDTSSPEQLITYGVRIGLNTSNQTSPKGDKTLNLDSWGTGFTAGAVVDLNFRDFFAIQPGIFFESRSHNYSYVIEDSNTPAALDINEYGHTRSTWIKVPLLASIRMNPSSSLRWSIDLGPVFGFGMGGRDKGTFATAETGPLRYKNGYFDDVRKKWSFGLKFGTTMRYKGHYLVGIHYESGTSSVYKDIKGGHHKAWTFTLGYDF